MGDQDTGLWFWNRLQKREEKCCGRCTLKKGWRFWGISLCYLDHPTRLDNISKGWMEEWWKRVDSHSKVASDTFTWKNDLLWYKVSYGEIAMELRIHIKVHVVQVSALDSLQLWRYTLWKIGILTSPEASQ